MAIGREVSELQSRQEQMRQDFYDYCEIVDERDQENFNRMQLLLTALRERYIKSAFSSLLIPRVNRHFMQWQLSRAFALEHTTLQYRLADEFEVLEAPDVLALSNKTGAGESNSGIGQSCQI